MNRLSLLKHTQKTLEEAGIESATREAEWLLMHVLGLPRTELYLKPDAPVSAGEMKRLEHLLARRLQREPLQYILGEADFMGLTLYVTPDVLIPRPETEEVVETALSCIADIARPRVLDVGTGSGCIALAIKYFRPDARVWACDVSPEALNVARRNAGRLGLEITFLLADVLRPDFPEHFPEAFHLIVSNPPYIPEQEAPMLMPEVRRYEPALALFSGDDALRFYRVLARHGKRLLLPGGYLVLEAHADYADDVAALLKRQGYPDVQVRHDLSGNPRTVIARRE